MNVNPFELIYDQLNEIKASLSDINLVIQSKPQNSNWGEWLNIDQVREYIPENPAPSTIYRWVADRTIPFHKSGKHLRFLKSEIDEWLKSGRKKTQKELEAGVLDRLKSN